MNSTWTPRVLCSVVQYPPVNVVPLSHVALAGVPCREYQPMSNASAQVSALASFMGSATNQLVVLGQLSILVFNHNFVL